MNDIEGAEEKTSKFIEEFVQRHWDEHSAVCYLSSLGFRLKHDLPESQSVILDGLHEYLRRNPVVTVVKHPDVYEKIGAVPLSVSVPDSPEELFGQKRKPATVDRNASYSQSFWDAFFKPIDGGARFVCLDADGKVEVSDGHNGEPEKNCYKILPEDLTSKLQGATISDRVAATHEAINSWLSKNSLQQELFSAPKKSFKHGSGNRLQAFFSAFEGIPERDLSRIQIPLDILVKLNSEK